MRAPPRLTERQSGRQAPTQICESSDLSPVSYTYVSNTLGIRQVLHHAPAKSGERHMRFHGLSHHAATLCIVAALAAQPAAAKVISVSASTPDANEKLQEALILAEPGDIRSEEHTSALQSLKRKPYAGLCLKKKQI